MLQRHVAPVSFQLIATNWTFGCHAANDGSEPEADHDFRQGRPLSGRKRQADQRGSSGTTDRTVFGAFSFQTLP